MSMALVLGGGGPVGIAWETGVLCGLQDEGIDLSQASRIVGTSAGSIVGANLALSRSLEAFYKEQAVAPPGEDPQGADMSGFMEAFGRASAEAKSPNEFRKAVGRYAAEAQVQGSDQWLASIRSRLPAETWPDADLRLTAIDVAEGTLVEWDRNCGVPLVLAVASSCAVPCVFPLVEIHGRRYMDGGIGSSTNSAVATGFGYVLVLDPIGHLPMVAESKKDEVARLAQAGSRVECVTPDEAAAGAIGFDLMNPAKRGVVAALGREQGRRVASLPSMQHLRVEGLSSSMGR